MEINKAKVLIRKTWDDLALALLGLSISILSLHGIVAHIVFEWYLFLIPLSFSFVFGLAATIPWCRSYRELRNYTINLNRIPK